MSEQPPADPKLDPARLKQDLKAELMKDIKTEQESKLRAEADAEAKKKAAEEEKNNPILAEVRELKGSLQSMKEERDQAKLDAAKTKLESINKKLYAKYKDSKDLDAISIAIEVAAEMKGVDVGAPAHSSAQQEKKEPNIPGVVGYFDPWANEGKGDWVKKVDPEKLKILIPGAANL